MAYLIGWGSPFDADDHTYKVFGTDKGANYSGYSNELVDKYLTEARQSDDKDVRAEAYDKFQEELAKNPAFAFICYIDANYVAKSSIEQSRRFRALHRIPLWDITVLEFSGILRTGRLRSKKQKWMMNVGVTKWKQDEIR